MVKYSIPGYGSYTNRELNNLTMDEIFEILVDLNVSTQSQYDKWLLTDRRTSIFWPITPKTTTNTTTTRRPTPPPPPPPPRRTTSLQDMLRQKINQRRQASPPRRLPPPPPPMRMPTSTPGPGCPGKPEFSCKFSPNCLWTGANCVTR